MDALSCPGNRHNGGRRMLALNFYIKVHESFGISMHSDVSVADTIWAEGDSNFFIQDKKVSGYGCTPNSF